MQVTTIVIGAGAAGMMCAAHAGPGVLVLDHARAAGEKIRISGGGRCNFTNMHCAPGAYVSANPHFCKSALARYTQWDFIDLVAQAGIAYHEKTLGQLFCDDSAGQIIQLLRDQMAAAGAQLWLQTKVDQISHSDGLFHLTVTREGRQHRLSARHLVVATGGKSIPKMGATDFGYRIARQFDLPVTDTRAGLVPLTFTDQMRDRFRPLSGLSVPARLSCNGASFDEGMLFTHRGLSGPSVLQISSYWHEGDAVTLSVDPQGAILTALRAERQTAGRKAVSTALARHLPARLAAMLLEDLPFQGTLADQSDKDLEPLAQRLQHWQITPSGSEGYRTAEVTLGGVDTDALSSKTMQAKTVPGLYFIGEVVDVTGWLGGYNFQWAWSSGWAAGQAIQDGLRAG